MTYYTVSREDSRESCADKNNVGSKKGRGEEGAIMSRRFRSFFRPVAKVASGRGNKGLRCRVTRQIAETLGA